MIQWAMMVQSLGPPLSLHVQTLTVCKANPYWKASFCGVSSGIMVRRRDYCMLYFRWCSAFHSVQSSWIIPHAVCHWTKHTIFASLHRRCSGGVTPNSMTSVVTSFVTSSHVYSIAIYKWKIKRWPIFMLDLFPFAMLAIYSLPPLRFWNIFNLVNHFSLYYRTKHTHTQ